MKNYEILAPLYEHDELAHMDDADLIIWAKTAGVPVQRDWAGRPATTIADAYKLRADFDAEHLRRAEADNARHAELEAEDELRFGRVRRQMEADARREALRAEIDVLEPEQVDARYLEWERRATENGDARFANLTAEANRPEPETRDAITRLKDKEASR